MTKQYEVARNYQVVLDDRRGKGKITMLKNHKEFKIAKVGVVKLADQFQRKYGTVNMVDVVKFLKTNFSKQVRIDKDVYLRIIKIEVQLLDSTGKVYLYADGRTEGIADVFDSKKGFMKVRNAIAKRDIGGLFSITRLHGKVPLFYSITV